jgi:BirA family transcriptional regulator, biotin operon repressor / biotin---[acetyl-CoA-carboxylase] ligase
MMADWNLPQLQAQLSDLLPGLQAQVVEQTASTSSDLLAYAKGLQSTPYLLVAQHQTQGRGRMGRSWNAAPGASLTFSLALPFMPPSWSGLSLALGCALAEALEPEPTPGHPRVALKWPNDLWCMDHPLAAGIPGHKIGGILIETCAVGSERVAVIGIGLNISPQPNTTFSPPHGHLQTLLPGLQAPQVLQRIARPLVQALQHFAQHGCLYFAARYAQRDALCGHPITTTDATLPCGIARGISAQGGLWLETHAGKPWHDITHGEISVRREPIPPSHPTTTPC